MISSVALLHIGHMTYSVLLIAIVAAMLWHFTRGDVA